MKTFNSGSVSRCQDSDDNQARAASVTVTVGAAWPPGRRSPSGASRPSPASRRGDLRVSRTRAAPSAGGPPSLTAPQPFGTRLAGPGRRSLSVGARQKRLRVHHLFARAARHPGLGVVIMWEQGLRLHRKELEIEGKALELELKRKQIEKVQAEIDSVKSRWTYRFIIFSLGFFLGWCCRGPWKGEI